MEHWRVQLPPDVERPFEVYVNGVLQQEGEDYRLVEDSLLFARPLVQEGRLGFWRWFWGAWGIGTYRPHHTVDVRWERDGRPRLAHALPVIGPEGDDR